MKIEVKSIKLLFLYRTFLFRHIIFYTEDKSLISIVNALNIKERKQRIEYVYDEAIKYINTYYSQDLCKFENNQCIAQRKVSTENINGCCRKCHLVTNNGCSSVNLACKLIYCKIALGNIEPLKFYQIPILKCLSVLQRLILYASFFDTKEEILKKLNYGIVYSFIKSLKGIIKNRTV